MQRHLRILIMLGMVVGFMAAGCGDDGEDDAFIGDGGANNNGTDSLPNGTDTNPGQQPAACVPGTLLENFDAAVMPSGWTIVHGAGGSGSNSNSNSGTGSGAGGLLDDINNDTTWHHSSLETEKFAPEPVAQNMSGGFFKVGDILGMDEAFLSDYYDIAACSSVILSFKQYFEDWGSNEADRGEVSILVDKPPWELLKTFNVTGYTEEQIDLTSYLIGGQYFQLKFHFIDEGKGNWPWFIDDVSITSAQ